MPLTQGLQSINIIRGVSRTESFGICGEGKATTIGTEFIWFDLGYTLVYVNREEVYRERLLPKGVVKSLEELRLAYHLADKYFMREHPGLLGKQKELFMTEYYKVLHQYLGISEEELSFEQSIAESQTRPEWKVFPDTLSTLFQLKEQGIGVGLISNWDETARDVLKQTGILPLLDEVVISSEIGIEKPDERIFVHALNLIDVHSSVCLYVGDNYYDDVIGSRQVNMESVLINPYERQGIEEIPTILTVSNIKELLPTLEKQGMLGSKVKV